MSLFRKPKKNLRQRVATVDSEEEADDGKNEAGPGVQVEIKLAPVKTKPVKSAAEAKKKTSSTLRYPFHFWCKVISTCHVPTHLLHTTKNLVAM